MKTTIDLNEFVSIIQETERNIRKNSRLLCELDAVVGDGDHGSTIARGLKKAVEVIDNKPPSSISELLVNVGNTMIESMGGASGPIFGSLFKEMGKAAEGKEEAALPDLYEMYDRGAQKIMKLGQAQPGDKTLLDSLVPAINALKTASENQIGIVEAFAQMLEAAKSGVEATKSMIASKGRARYGGDRGKGHQDAGATSVVFMIEAGYNSLIQSDKLI